VLSEKKVLAHWTVLGDPHVGMDACDGPFATTSAGETVGVDRGASCMAWHFAAGTLSHAELAAEALEPTRA
jgi:hypothetical protein